jgi:hypothetical protein
MRDEAISDGELDQLLMSNENARSRWLDRRCQPAPESNWWLHLLPQINERWERRPTERAA